jgi:hypothetical protein
MTLDTLHDEIGKLLYIEDRGMIDVILASIVANSLKLGDPVWLTLIGPSSGGKSQIIRPISQARPQLIHRLDDLTPNTFISGSLGIEHSFLGRMGNHGIISMDDLTVLFSKNAEARGEILSQFRMIYDGRFSKSSGNRKEDMLWPVDKSRGYVGIISGSTPSIYRFLAEVADMGERFINYRMKPTDMHKMADFINANTISSESLDKSLEVLYTEFLTKVIQDPLVGRHTILSQEVKDVISHMAEYATLLRTPVHIDERLGLVDEFPETEGPGRIMKQLTYLAQGLQIINQGPLTPQLIHTLEWTAWSLANDKRRAYLKAIVQLNRQSQKITARNISAITGLHRDVVKKGLDHFQALHIISLTEDDAGEYEWFLEKHELVDIVMRLDPPKSTQLSIDDYDN